MASRRLTVTVQTKPHKETGSVQKSVSRSERSSALGFSGGYFLSNWKFINKFDNIRVMLYTPPRSLCEANFSVRILQARSTFRLSYRLEIKCFIFSEGPDNRQRIWFSFESAGGSNSSSETLAKNPRLALSEECLVEAGFLPDPPLAGLQVDVGSVCRFCA
jgi:hypothetical protein